MGERLVCRGVASFVSFMMKLLDIADSTLADLGRDEFPTLVAGWCGERVVLGDCGTHFASKRAYLERLLAGRLRPRRGAKIWLLVTLEAWLRRVFDRSRPLS